MKKLNEQTIARRTTASPCICVVCGDVARYSYYGAIVCLSCKVFFRRNARTQPIPLICKFGDHCEINMNNRRSCSSCRLAKCFSSGMSADLIRSDRTAETNSTLTRRNKSSRNNQPEQIRTLNLLQSDQSTLSTDEWTHLSNIIHCFDQYNGLEYVQQFIEEQNSLPVKLRYKHQSVHQFFITMMSKIQILFEKNRDLLSLSSNDRKLLLRCTIAYTTCFGGAFLFQQTHLLDDSIFSRSAQSVIGFSSIDLLQRLINQFDLDINFIKILFSIISFLISNFTCYKHTPSEYLHDEKSLIHIQDTYTDLAWKYFSYKHSYQDTILCFSNLLRCLLLLNDSVVKAYQEKEFQDIMNSVIQSTEQKLTIDNT